MPPKDNDPNAPYVTEEQPSFSFLGTFSKFAVIGGGIVAAIAFGGPALAGVLEKVDADSVFKTLAETTGKTLVAASDKVNTLGGTLAEHLQLENIGLSKEMAGKTAAAVAGAIGLGLGGSLISSFAHAGDNSTLPNVLAHTAHAASHTLST
jgi:hypothetical protein